jgi:hypothetical protein
MSPSRATSTGLIVANGTATSTAKKLRSRPLDTNPSHLGASALAAPNSPSRLQGTQGQRLRRSRAPIQRTLDESLRLVRINGPLRRTGVRCCCACGDAVTCSKRPHEGVGQAWQETQRLSIFPY